MNQAQYVLARNSQVEVTHRVTQDGYVQAHVVVDNLFEHTFSRTSRVSEPLNLARNSDQMKLAASQLQQRLNGGQFFFVDAGKGYTLIDHRDGTYNGWVHSEQSIDKLMEVIGIQTDVSQTRRVGMRLNTTVSPIVLAKQWSTEGFHIDGYLDGGAFTSGITFGWSPFMNHVKGIFEIVRQICSNGMVGTSDLINSKIPLQNRWDEHLILANKQMQNMVQSKVATRLYEMGEQRAAVSILMAIAKHARCRLVNEDSNHAEDARLYQLANIADPKLHLGNYYEPHVFDDNNVGARVPGHLSMFDAWNLTTEMYTHTPEAEDSTNGGLQRLANGLLFPQMESTKGQIIDRIPLLSAFSDPDKAFFGAH